MQRAVNAEAKAGLKSSAMVQDLDTYCFKGHRFFHATLAKIQIQGFNIKESKPKKSRLKKLKPAKGKTPTLSCFKSIKLGKTFCIDKKRKYLKKKQDQKINTLAIGNNANIVESSKKKQNHDSNKRYYNY